MLVTAYFKVAKPNHRFDYVPHTGELISVAKKTAVVRIGTRDYRVKRENVVGIDDSTSLARKNID